MLFERMHSEQRWENQAATGWSVEDLDVAEIRNTVAEAVRIGRLDEPGSREPADLLRGLGLIRDGVLFRAAAVLFGNAERLEFEMPQCLLRVARFRGLDRSEFLDNRQFNGNAFELLSSAGAFYATPFPSQAGSNRAASSALTNRFTRPWPHGKRWRTPCAIGTMRWAAARWGWRCTTTVLR